jgi:site-specific DNA recombinase
MRAVVYLRQSLDRTGTGAAVERQRIDCEKLCADRGWEIVRRYVDNDTSASSTKARPQYQALLAALERGEAEVVVAWHVDRLTRKLTELEELIVLAERTGVRIATATGDVDLSTDSGRLVGRILASVARGEVERKGARQRRAQQQAAQAGKPAGGRRAFGYSADSMSINPAEAELVREAYRAVLEGASLSSIAADWNRVGVTTTAGNAWTHSTVRQVVANPRNAARRTYRGEVVGPAQWPALVDDDTFDAAHALLRLPERRTTTGTARLYLLPGLAHCHCGGKVTTGRTQHGVRTYRCKVLKGHMSRAAQPIDDLVVDVVLERLSRPDATELLHDVDRPDLPLYREKAHAIRERLNDLATALAEGVLSLHAVRDASERLRGQLKEVEAQMASLEASDVLGPLVAATDLAATWESLPLSRQRAVIDTLMTVTLLKPLRGRQAFDPTSVRIDWKG